MEARNLRAAAAYLLRKYRARRLKIVTWPVGY
jgi:hypothetical protein